MQKLAVFDCDGTLVDGQAEICESMRTAFAAAGMPAPDRQSIRRIVGLSLPRAVQELAPRATPHQQKTIIAAYKEAYRTARERGVLHEPLFEGMAGLLDRLLDEGWLLGVATGKSERGLNACLATHAIDQHFITLQTADYHPSKPHPAMLRAALAEANIEPQYAVMIGDTTFDIEMAVAAGVRGIGVGWGYHEPYELTAVGASGVANTIGELERLIHE